MKTLAEQIQEISPFARLSDEQFDEWIKLAIEQGGFYTPYMPLQVTNGFVPDDKDEKLAPE